MTKKKANPSTKTSKTKAPAKVAPAPLPAPVVLKHERIKVEIDHKRETLSALGNVAHCEFFSTGGDDVA